MFRQRMTMRAHLQRDAAAEAADPWNSAAPPEWEASGDPVPCYAWALLGSADAAKHADGRKTALVERYRMAVPLGSGVTPEHRVERIADSRGRTVFGGPLTVDAVRELPTHAEADLGGGRPV